MTNNNWCDARNISILSRSCSPDLEHLSILCRPFYLPREFSAVIPIAVYIPPQANTISALSSLHDVISKHLSDHPDAALLVIGDFNKANLKQVLPHFFQHISCPTRGERTLDHCYSPFKDAYKASSLPAFGKSDHAAVMLLPKYKQRLRREAPSTREVSRWSDHSEALLQDALADVDWDMFRESSDSIDEFTDVVTCFISELASNIISTVTVKIYPNQKPWVDRSIREALNARTTAYNECLLSGNMAPYKSTCYELRKAVKLAKKRYREKVELNLSNNDSRSVWQGLKMITDYKRPPLTMAADSTLVNELNAFYARFEVSDDERTHSNAHVFNSASDAIDVHTGVCPLPSVSMHDVRRVLKQVNGRKAAGPDGIPGRLLKSCADQLAPVFTTIFNLSLASSTVPNCFKRSTIIPVPKKANPSCLNDYRPIALTSVVMKCFEKLVKNIICSSVPGSLDPLQFAYRENRSTDDAISHVLHTTLSHLDKGQGNYARLLFIDYSSAFNTIVPSKLVSKLKNIGLCHSLCAWILNFLSNRPQAVKIGNCSSSIISLNIGAPQGCVLSPLLYSLYTHDCSAIHSSNSIVKFADDTVVVGLISNNDETAYLNEVEMLSSWCAENSLELNVTKTKELVVDYRRGKDQKNYAQLEIFGTPVERVSCFKYLGVNISEDLSWSPHITTVVKKARQRLYHLRRLRKFRIPSDMQKSFYSATIESVITGSITTWYGNCTAQDKIALHRVVHAAEKITGAILPGLQDVYARRTKTRAQRIMKDTFHPSHSMFERLPSGKRLRSIRCRTERLRKSFFPQAIRFLN